MSPSSAASLGSGSVREMPSTTSHANSIWTDLHSVASLTAGASSRVELLDSLRDDEMSCVSMQRAYKDKISKRKRHVNHVDMRKMTGRSRNYQRRYSDFVRQGARARCLGSARRGASGARRLVRRPSLSSYLRGRGQRGEAKRTRCVDFT